MSTVQSAPPRILIADDDAIVRLIARAVVERAGMQATEAVDGVEAIASISSQRFDLILLDLEMPRAGGLDVIRHARSNPETSGVPILVLTGADGAEVAEAVSLGASGVVPKPIAAERLLGRIREVVG